MKYKDYKDKALKDPEVKKAYAAMGPEFEIISAMIDIRNQKGLTQQDLSELSGITQADISRIERGDRNPGIRTVQKLANAMGFSIGLIPLKQKN